MSLHVFYKHRVNQGGEVVKEFNKTEKIFNNGRKNNVIQIRVSDQEKEVLRKLAEKLNLSISDFIKEACEYYSCEYLGKEG